MHLRDGILLSMPHPGEKCLADCGLFFQRVPEPGPRVLPVAVGNRPQEIQRLARLIDGKSSEEVMEQFEPHPTAAPLRSFPITGMIDQDAAHGLGRSGEQVPTAIEVLVPRGTWRAFYGVASRFDTSSPAAWEDWSDNRWGVQSNQKENHPCHSVTISVRP